MNDGAVGTFIAGLSNRQELAHLKQIPARDQAFGAPHNPISQALTDALNARGISRLYSHQAACLDAVREGRDVVVCAGTASGKTLAFLLPILDRMEANPQARALFIYPTNALVNDQAAALSVLLRELNLGLACGVYTGQTAKAERDALKAAQPNILLTNPEMLHYGMLPWHHTWTRTLANLEFVVVDEVHKYTGVFGAHVSHLLARLRHVCHQNGASPRFLFASATIANAAEHAAQLAGRDVTLIDKDGAGTRAKHFLLWNPLATPDGASQRRGDTLKCINEAAVELLARLVELNLPTIAFVRGRKQTEELARLVSDSSSGASGPASAAVAAYHGDMDGRVRRNIEDDLRAGRIACVVTTNALELGVDIGDLDACLIKGFPGSFVSIWQQAGRAGRRSDDSVVVYVADADPVDQYYMRHPEEFFGKPFERAVVDRGSPRILEQHLLSMLVENDVLVAHGDVEKQFGAAGLQVMQWLIANGYVEALEPWQRCDRCGREMVIREGKRGKFLGCTGFRAGRCDHTAAIGARAESGGATLACPDAACGATYAVASGARFCHRCGKALETKTVSGLSWKISDNVDPKALRAMPLRSMDAEEYKMVEASGQEVGIVVGSRDIHRDAHLGAIYTVGGASYRVTSLDRQNREVVVERESGAHITIPRCDREILVRQHERSSKVGAWEISFGDITFKENVSGFLEIDTKSGRRAGGTDFSKPFTWKLETRGFVAYVPRPGAGCAYGTGVRDEDAFRGGLAGIASALDSVIAPLVMCDRRDIDGMSLPVAPGRPDCGLLSVFDRFDGGIGLAAKAFEEIELVLSRAYDLVTSCSCQNAGGCAKCLLAPGLAVREGDIDKVACVAILGSICSGE